MCVCAVAIVAQGRSPTHCCKARVGCPPLFAIHIGPVRAIPPVSHLRRLAQWAVGRRRWAMLQRCACWPHGGHQSPDLCGCRSRHRRVRLTVSRPLRRRSPRPRLRRRPAKGIRALAWPRRAQHRQCQLACRCLSVLRRCPHPKKVPPGWAGHAGSPEMPTGQQEQSQKQQLPQQTLVQMSQQLRRRRWRLRSRRGSQAQWLLWPWLFLRRPGSRPRMCAARRSRTSSCGYRVPPRPQSSTTWRPRARLRRRMTSTPWLRLSSRQSRRRPSACVAWRLPPPTCTGTLLGPRTMLAAGWPPRGTTSCRCSNASTGRVLPLAPAHFKCFSRCEDVASASAVAQGFRPRRRGEVHPTTDTSEVAGGHPVVASSTSRPQAVAG